jgi:hypothetical protein
MPPCYTFDKLCIPSDGMSPCAGAGAAAACPVQNWFWILAAALGVGLLVANVGKS